MNTKLHTDIHNNFYFFKSKPLPTIKIITLVFLTLFSISAFSQATIYVNSSTGNDTSGDGTTGLPYKTFHKGYTASSSGDTIDLTGTFTWTDADETGDALRIGYTISKNLTIQGQGPGNTIVQAHSSPLSADRRVFAMSNNKVVTFNH